MNLASSAFPVYHCVIFLKVGQFVPHDFLIESDTQDKQNGIW